MNDIRHVYLDCAAATPVDSQVSIIMQQVLETEFQNPSAIYVSARAAKARLEDARTRVAHWLGARPNEIVFTAGATEANNLALAGMMHVYPNAKMLVSSIEHESVIATSEKFDHEYIPVDAKGQVNQARLAEQLKDDSVCLVSVMYANNEIGVIQDLRIIAQMMEVTRKDRQERNVEMPLLLHTDAAQAINYLDLHVNKLKVDLMTLSAGKAYGPKQSGALYVRAGIELEPLLFGGGQEHGLRSGTESLVSAFGLATAMDVAQSMRKQEAARQQNLRAGFIRELDAFGKDSIVHSHRKHTLPNIISISFLNLDGERAVMMLDEQGIECGTGSACSALSDESSHVIKALGFDESIARGTLRFSMGRMTKPEDIKYVIEVLRGVLANPHVWVT